jgi:zinc protease
MRCLITVLLTCLWASQSRADVPSASEFSLPNGLRVIVQEDHRAPVAVVQVWYRVGGSHEQDGQTGLSHVLEHLMFKRTQHLAPGEFSREVARRGGRENAFTSNDYTVYYQHWAAQHVPESFRLEAERMQYLELQEKEVTNELKVIREERRLRTDDDPLASALEVILANTWQTSPYRQPVIGWAADIEQLTVPEIGAWYDRYYAPGNAIVVVVGDVKVDALRTLAADTFGKIPARATPQPRRRPEVPQLGQKRLEIRDPRLRVPMLMINYKIPGLTSVGQGEDAPLAWEIHALEVLAALLDGGASARFPRELVRGENGVALSASASCSVVSRLPDLFSLQGIPKPGISLERLEAALLEQLQRIRETPPTETELARIKTAVIAEQVYQRDSPFGEAMSIGALAAVGLDWRLKDSYVDAVRAVTAEQVQQVARRYLRAETSTVAWLSPGEAASEAPQEKAHATP